MSTFICHKCKRTGKNCVVCRDAQVIIELSKDFSYRTTKSVTPLNPHSTPLIPASTSPATTTSAAPTTKNSAAHKAAFSLPFDKCPQVWTLTFIPILPFGLSSNLSRPSLWAAATRTKLQTLLHDLQSKLGCRSFLWPSWWSYTFKENLRIL